MILMRFAVGILALCLLGTAFSYNGTASGYQQSARTAAIAIAR